MNLSILARCGLFRGIETAELSPLLRRLHACTREFDKFQPIYRVGDTAHALCILLSGGVNTSAATHGATRRCSTTLRPVRYSLKRTPACPARP